MKLLIFIWTLKKPCFKLHGRKVLDIFLYGLERAVIYSKPQSFKERIEVLESFEFIEKQLNVIYNRGFKDWKMEQKLLENDWMWLLILYVDSQSRLVY